MGPVFWMQWDYNIARREAPLVLWKIRGLGGGNHSARTANNESLFSKTGQDTHLARLVNNEWIFGKTHQVDCSARYDCGLQVLPTPICAHKWRAVIYYIYTVIIHLSCGRTYSIFISCLHIYSAVELCAVFQNNEWLFISVVWQSW